MPGAVGHVVRVMCTLMHGEGSCNRRGLVATRMDSAGARLRRWRPCSSTCWSPRTSTSCATARAWPRRAAAAAAPAADAASFQAPWRGRPGGCAWRPRLAALAALVVFGEAWEPPEAPARGRSRPGGTARAWQRPRGDARLARALHDNCCACSWQTACGVAHVTYVNGAALIVLQWTHRRRALILRHCTGASQRAHIHKNLTRSASQ